MSTPRPRYRLSCRRQRLPSAACPTSTSMTRSRPPTSRSRSTASGGRARHGCDHLQSTTAHGQAKRQVMSAAVPEPPARRRRCGGVMQVSKRSATVAGALTALVLTCAGNPASAGRPPAPTAASTPTSVLPAASPAPAESSSKSPLPSSASYADPRGDVWRTTDSDETSLDATPAPRLVPSDVIRVRFRHLHTRVRLRMTFVDLQRPAPPQAPQTDGTLFAVRVFVYVATSQGNGQLIEMDIRHYGARRVTCTHSTQTAGLPVRPPTPSTTTRTGFASAFLGRASVTQSGCAWAW